jgi:hypothetical protein
MIARTFLGRPRTAESPLLEPTPEVLALLDQLPADGPARAAAPVTEVPWPVHHAPTTERPVDASDPWRTAGAAVEPRVETVEVIGRFLRVSGDMSLTRFERLSDFVNITDGFLTIRDATILKRNGEPTRVTLPELWVSRDEITLIGQHDVEPSHRTGHGLYIPKAPQRLVFVTRGHLINAAVYLLPGATTAAFAEATDPRFVPLSDVNCRSLADRRVISHYGFALLNRRQVVAIGESPAIGDAV